MQFIDASGNTVGSTQLGRAVLSVAVPELATEIAQTKNWRTDYLKFFRSVAMAEHATKVSAADVASRGLTMFEQSVVTDDGRNLLSVIHEAWRSKKDLVSMVVIKGTGLAQQPNLDAAKMVEMHLAEPMVAEVLQDLNTANIQDNLLIALAGGAEYSPARTWLDWGGSVAIVARNRAELWRELISRARSGSGTLYVPVLKSRVGNKDVQTLSDRELAEVAGLDLITDYEAIAGWLSMLARTESRGLVLGSYAYAPGVKHIEVQAVQHCLSRVMTEALPKSRVTLTWLATPTDSYAVGSDFIDDINLRYSKRSSVTKLRDVVFRAKKHQPQTFKTEAGVTLAIIDSTSSVQGPSYALAKRVQRWLAYQQLFADRNVAYLVSPPAKTESVLSKRILKATYAGAPKFGLVPFEVKTAVDLSAGLLLASLNQPVRRSPMASYLDLAVHGGLWRLIYSPRSTWQAATVRGIFGLLK
jgi:hypothetical protein